MSVEQLFDNTLTNQREAWDERGWVAAIDRGRLAMLANPKSGYGSDWLRWRWEPQHAWGHYPDRKV